jgi:hypothetical protein
MFRVNCEPLSFDMMITHLQGLIPGLVGFLIFVLLLAFLIARYYESGEAQSLMADLRKLYKSLGIPGRVVLGVLFVVMAYRGGAKAPPAQASLYRTLFWHADDIWALKPATDTLADSSTASSNAIADATSAINTMAETAAMLATQPVWTSEFDWNMENRTPQHDEQNVMSDEMWRENVRIDGTLFHDHYIRFNAMVSTNPAIISIAYNGFDPTTGERARILAEVTTNSYPNTFEITRPSGVYTCYMFRCACPVALTNEVIGWDSEVLFGTASGSKRGFNISGIFVVSRDGKLWIGRTYTNHVFGATNVVINGLKIEEEE